MLDSSSTRLLGCPGIDRSGDTVSILVPGYSEAAGDREGGSAVVGKCVYTSTGALTVVAGSRLFGINISPPASLAEMRPGMRVHAC